ncbi:DMT family transporter, partial [Candidatus Marinimicrobia bacterium]|nr:DMT family transporter [Candidatus Neomarinimicrobiota bacterium]
MMLPYFGEICMLIAAILWSVTVILLKSSSNQLSPFLINPIKNSIGLLLFLILFIYMGIPLWYDNLSQLGYYKILLSGLLGMAIGDTIFIYALSKIGANRVAIVDSFSPFIIYFYSILLLSNQELVFIQFVGLMITTIAIVILTYENDSEDIDYKTKRAGILWVFFAMSCTGYGIVLLKTVLNEINIIEVDQKLKFNLWVTAFRLLPGVIFSWFMFLFKKNKKSLLQPLTNKSVLSKLLLASIIGPFFALGFWILGYAFIDKPSIASIISQTSVIFIVILSWIFLKEKLTPLRLVSISFAFIGVLLA